MWTERRAGAVPIRRREVGLVERVEDFGAEFEGSGFTWKPELFMHAEVEIVIGTAASDIAAGVAIGVADIGQVCTLFGLKYS